MYLNLLQLSINRKVSHIDWACNLTECDFCSSPPVEAQSKLQSSTFLSRHICLLISAVWDFFFSFLPVLCMYSYFKRPVQQHILYEWIHSATYREAVLICALLSLMKTLWTDDGVSSSCADSVRSRSCGLQVCPCCLDDGVNTFYDKLERENTAGSDNSGMRQPVESVHSFWSEID